MAHIVSACVFFEIVIFRSAEIAHIAPKLAVLFVLSSYMLEQIVSFLRFVVAQFAHNIFISFRFAR